MTRPDEIAALANDELISAFAREVLCHDRDFNNEPDLYIAELTRRLAATSPGDAVRDKPVEDSLELQAQQADEVRGLRAALAPAEKASGMIAVTVVEDMIARWQKECSAFPDIYNQGNVLLERLKGLEDAPAEKAGDGWRTDMENAPYGTILIWVAGSPWVALRMNDDSGWIDPSGDTICALNEPIKWRRLPDDTATPTPPSGDVAGSIAFLIRQFIAEQVEPTDYGTKFSGDELNKTVNEIVALIQSAAPGADPHRKVVFDRAKAALAPAEKAGDVVQAQDVRWGVNVLLETIAKKFEENDTWDIWKSDAAALVRGFKHAATPTPPSGDVEKGFQLGDRVQKVKGSSWHGTVCGFYSTSLTPVGYAVESEREPGSVQIYPEAALELIQSAAPGGGTKSDGDLSSTTANEVNKPSANSRARDAGMAAGPSDAQEPDTDRDALLFTILRYNLNEMLHAGSWHEPTLKRAMELADRLDAETTDVAELAKLVATLRSHPFTSDPAQEPQAVAWHDPSEIPSVKAGSYDQYIVAVRRAYNGKVYSFAGEYLNAYPLRYDDCCPKGDGCEGIGCEDRCPTTGWYQATGDGDDGTTYNLLLGKGDELVGWRKVPKWEDRFTRPVYLDREALIRKCAEKADRHSYEAGQAVLALLEGRT